MASSDLPRSGGMGGGRLCEFVDEAHEVTEEERKRPRYGRPWRRPDGRVRVLCVIAAGLTLFAAGGVFHLAVPAVLPGVAAQFNSPALFRPWAGWTSTYMAAHPFGFGLVFALVYTHLRRKNVLAGWRGGLEFGVGVFLVGSLPVYLLAFASFQVSAEVVACWVVQSACQYAAAGAVVGAIAGR